MNLVMFVEVLGDLRTEDQLAYVNPWGVNVVRPGRLDDLSILSMDNGDTLMVRGDVASVVRALETGG